MRSTFMIGLLTIGALMACKSGKKETVPDEDTLKREQMASPDAFVKKYNGKPLSVFGKLEKVDLTSTTGFVEFESNVHEDKAFSGVVCEVDDADKARFQQLKVDVGSYARVGGTVKADGKLDFTIEHCKLEATGIDAMSK
jgi:hypothetical protein